MIKKKPIFFLILKLFVFLGLINCDLNDNISLPGGSEDSGFRLYIYNYSQIQYNESSFYLGFIDNNSNFVATDSLIYKNLVIYKKGDGPNYNAESGYSYTYPFNQNKNGLNKYEVWEPNEKTKSLYFNDMGLRTKIKFNEKTIISDFDYGLNGRIIFRILENGEISW
ncbi:MULTISPECIES: hypothetical protein [unclassified Polaribacter]|uniref:hypothetical protein n=1 Tax=unclassified Polaribacter TaxID=196858 RepID=UPI0011BF86F3|nr:MULTISPECIES: hypothetical protein [unclassified Polaribacter]TXD50760.1 hypothetical protein ES043_14755 [Polaribacter sp. IC063]TXD57456.1 hypothetical protein ES044_15015 [Polaribacter sp. IC066]